MSNSKDILNILASQDKPSPSLSERLKDCEIKDKDAKRWLRIVLQIWIMALLSIQFIILVMLMLWQAWSYNNFHLNEWAFGFYVNVCMAASYWVIRIIAKDLFPGVGSRNNTVKVR